MNPKTLLIGIIIIGAGLLWWFLRTTPNEQIIDTLPARDVTGQVTIVAFGDSLTAGYGLPLTDAYPAQLETALREKGISVKVVNAGVSGETTEGNKERAAFIRSQNPDVVLLGIGGNDALRQLSVEDAKANIVETVRTLKGGTNPPVIILLQMQAPLNAGLAYKRDFDAMYTAISDSEKIILVPFLTAEVFLNSANKLPDGIHLNQQGYKIVIDKYIVPTLIPVLSQIKNNAS